MTQPLPHRSRRRGGAPEGYEPVSVREWPTGQAPLGIPLSHGTVAPAVATIGWLAVCLETVLLRFSVPWWILYAFGMAGMLETSWWLGTTRALNRWHNAWLYQTDYRTRLRMPRGWLPRHVRDHPTGGVGLS